MHASNTDNATPAAAAAAAAATAADTEVDVVIIGSGIAGLCCGSLLAKYGYSVRVCESHYHAGGAAHAFTVKVAYLPDAQVHLYMCTLPMIVRYCGSRAHHTLTVPYTYSRMHTQGYHFDSGPSLFSGMSISESPNPLKHVLNAIGEVVDWLTYDTWGVFIPGTDWSVSAVRSADH